MRPEADLLLSLLTSSLRGWRGTQILRRAPAPARLPQLHDDEFDPGCRLVRELLTELNLDVRVLPCPRGGVRHRAGLPEGARPPVYRDHPGGRPVVGTEAVLRHLLRRYSRLPPGIARLLASMPMRLAARLAGLARAHVPREARPSRPPRRPLELYAFESSPYARRVRERLCVLELPYVLRVLGKERLADYGPAVRRLHLGPYRPRPGGRRAELLARVGRVQVPYLIDHDQGVALFESEAILAHLERHYARAPGDASATMP